MELQWLRKLLRWKRSAGNGSDWANSIVECVVCGRNILVRDAHYVCTCSIQKMLEQTNGQCFPVPTCATCFPTLRTWYGDPIPEQRLDVDGYVITGGVPDDAP